MKAFAYNLPAMGTCPMTSHGGKHLGWSGGRKECGERSRQKAFLLQGWEVVGGQGLCSAETKTYWGLRLDDF